MDVLDMCVCVIMLHHLHFSRLCFCCLESYFRISSEFCVILKEHFLQTDNIKENASLQGVLRQ